MPTRPHSDRFAQLVLKLPPKYRLSAHEMWTLAGILEACAGDASDGVLTQLAVKMCKATA